MLTRAYYDSITREFVISQPDAILGVLTRSHGHDLESRQRDAWKFEIKHLQDVLNGIDGHLFLEFLIPRMGKRADAILIHGGVIFVLEYKVGATMYSEADRMQAHDYALDLKNFHSGSHQRPIVPVLVATQAREKPFELKWAQDQVCEPILANASNLRSVVDRLASKEWPKIDPIPWAKSPYRPTPTIIEAAKALYEGHRVEEISRSDASTTNLTRTRDAVARLVQNSKSRRLKTIAFITGVPGSGKTLAGLNLATSSMHAKDDEHAVFLSGNGALVEVLREALTRDSVKQAKERGDSLSKKVAAQRANAFIQNIHSFRDDSLVTVAAPSERVVVFDEAQRAWTQKKTSEFMKEKRGLEHFDKSEPEFLLSVMDRHKDWCVVVCLVGGGQEINDGEAGLGEWLRALKGSFPHWKIAISDRLGGSEYAWGDLARLIKQLSPQVEPDLHLGVNVRSFRAEAVSEFVSAVIEGNADRARGIKRRLDHYPILMTRDLSAARRWLRGQARGSERTGLVASSNAIRLKAQGIFVKAKIDPAQWFLNDCADVRSSYALEDVATEFDTQGLELDWVGVCWDANFRYSKAGWTHHFFSGTKWQDRNNEFDRIYLANSYRVLLTRARQGIVIFVPEGDSSDVTRLPEYYDGTFEFLRACGVEVFSSRSRDVIQDHEVVRPSSEAGMDRRTRSSGQGDELVSVAYASDRHPDNLTHRTPDRFDRRILYSDHIETRVGGEREARLGGAQLAQDGSASGQLEAVLTRHLLRTIDGRSDGNPLYILTDDSNAEISRDLRSLGFQYNRADKRWWSRDPDIS